VKRSGKKEKLKDPPEVLSEVLDGSDIAVTPEITFEKNYNFRGPFIALGFIAIISSIFVIPQTLLFSFTKSIPIEIKVDNNIKIIITIKSNEFSNNNIDEICSGNKTLGKLSDVRIQLSINQFNWKTSTALGKGFLNKDNECVYTILQKAPTNFTGGEIGTQIFFKFGTTEIQKNTLETMPPWEVTQLITLNS